MASLFALIIGILVGSGVFLLLSRSIVRVVLGLAFIGYGVNLAILTVAGLEDKSPPLLTLPGPYVDPLPQALILTAIVIGFATTALLLTVALRAYQVAGHEDVEAFGDSLARDPDAPDGLGADPEHQSPDQPDWEEESRPAHPVSAGGRA
ncbi:NADH-quinone oxidoreductase subunit K [Deinococcus wulumuqiensis]